MTKEPSERFDTVDDLFERMAIDGRSRYVPANACEVETPEGLNEARNIVNQAIERGFVTAAELTRRTGRRPSAISAFRRNKWKGKAGTQCTLASELARAIDQLQRQRIAEETSLDGFVSIRVAEEIFSLAQYAMKRRKIVAFTLSAGNGKTTALQQLQLETPGAILVTVTKRRASPKSFLQLWSRQLSLRESGRAEDLQDRLVARLAGSDRLCIIDEAHKLPVASLDLVREVWDETHVPMILAATPSLYQTLTSRQVGESAHELMDQLYSRVLMFRNLDELVNKASNAPEPPHSAEDIRKLFARQHVRLMRDGVEFLRALANTPGAGGLRTCQDMIQMAIDFFPKEPVDKELLCKVLVSQLGPKEAGFRIKAVLQASEEATRRVAG